MEPNHKYHLNSKSSPLHQLQSHNSHHNQSPSHQAVMSFSSHCRPWHLQRSAHYTCKFTNHRTHIKTHFIAPTTCTAASLLSAIPDGVPLRITITNGAISGCISTADEPS
ncbi:hypothetical protein M0R45_005936 [Rubus argutus]|uniref:Uncharacterized protein n=1 Tax=Rubus argutus TaxID=59490 RepID=A0AAW1YPA8_RUBAR